MASNAFLLSALYLLVGIAVEAGRRFLSASALGQLAMRASLVLDALPARLLDTAGLLQPLQVRYLEGRLSEMAIRAAFGLTTVVLIFALAVLTGFALLAVRRLSERRSL